MKRFYLNQWTVLKYRKLSILFHVTGFSLIELLIAITILMVIAIAFTPLLLGSIRNVYYAGDKSEALYTGQSEMELRYYNKLTADGSVVEFTFSDEDGVLVEIEVAGGMVEIIEEEGSASAWLSSFIPFVPTINIEPSPFELIEGYDPLTITIKGRDTELTNGQGVSIYTDDDQAVPSILTGNLKNVADVVPDSNGTPTIYTQSADFELEKGLINAKEPYLVELKWYVDANEEVEVRVRARLRVLLPLGVVVGDGGNIITSPDINTTWNLRESESAVAGPNYNDVIWAYSSYIVVTADGSILNWTRQEKPVTINLSSSSSLNSLAYNNNILVAVGDKGTIATSTNGQNWTVEQTNKDYDLHSVAVNESGQFMSVGSKGYVLTSVDGIDWTEMCYAELVDANINGIAYGSGNWVIAGAYIAGDSEGKAVIFYEDNDADGTGIIWKEVVSDTGNTAFYDICYNGPENGSQFMAVGKGGDGKKGLIMISEESGQLWAVDPDLTDTLANNNTFSAIHWNEYSAMYTLLSKEGNILINDVNNGNGWVSIYTDSSDALKGVAYR